MILMDMPKDIFPQKTVIAVERCIALNIPFALLMMPGSDETKFYASTSTTGSPVTHDGYFREGVAIGFFAEDPEKAIYIPAELNEDDIIAMPSAMESLSQTTAIIPATATSFIPYYSIVRDLIEQHKYIGGKTVFSRVIKVDTSVPIVTVAARYFSQMRTAFRFLYFTPDSGLWLGATPELLYQWNSKNHDFQTMALAGTRRQRTSDMSVSWDSKNKEEHEYVSRFILDSLNELGIKAKSDILEDNSLSFGTIEHICRRFYGKTKVAPAKVIEKLNPTPAVCGWPVEIALKNILENEPHDRNCYAGFISVCEGSDFRAYVNLRSAAIVPLTDGNCSYTIYAGGGITRKSTPINEWKEAAFKASYLYRAATEGSTIPFVPVEELLTTTLEKEIDKAIGSKTLNT